jgi:hypothetical protein
MPAFFQSSGGTLFGSEIPPMLGNFQLYMMLAVETARQYYVKKIDVECRRRTVLVQKSVVFAIYPAPHHSTLYHPFYYCDLCNKGNRWKFTDITY